MTAKKCIHYLLFVIPVMVICINHGQAASHEALGRAAEKEGKLRQAISHYANELPSVSAASAKDLELRKKIIRLSWKLQPPPAIPDEIFEYEGRAEAAIKSQAYADAVKEYRRILLMAPWVADYYFNSDIVFEKFIDPKESTL